MKIGVGSRASDTDIRVQDLSFAEFAEKLRTPKVGPKDGLYVLRGGLMKAPVRENENLLEAELVVIDGDGSFDGETGEVLTAVDPDDGRTKGNSTPIEVAKKALDAMEVPYVLHSTHSHRPGILNRWRAYIPARMTSQEELNATVDFVIEQMHAHGCYVEANKESRTWAQPWYTPRCKPEYLDSYLYFCKLEGKDLDVATAVEASRKQRRAAESAARKQERPQAQPGTQGPSPIETFNNAATVDLIRVLLEQAGYKFAFKRRDALRFIAPQSETRMPGVTVFKGAKRGDLVIYSHHGAHDPLSGRLTDAFGLLWHVTHAGNKEAALEDAKRAINWKAKHDNLEGFDVEEITPEDFSQARADAKKPAGPIGPIKTLSLVDLMDDDSPEEPDYISPDFLGAGNFCLIAGPPKAQKSFLLTEMLIACATGTSFLGGRFTVTRPLKVFYLQAEMNRKLLRRRAKMMAFLDDEQKQLLHANLVVTERLTMQLTEEGAKAAIEAMKGAFPDGGPDIIAIDPLANLFDGDNEDKAPEIMRFLTQRLEVIRRAVNPLAAIVLVHHSAKKTTEDMARDPFVAIRGSGALRGYYDTGIVIYRKSEEGAERQVHFEFRNGESPDAMTVKLNGFGSFSVVDTSMGAISRSMAVAMLAEIDKRWREGKPLAMASQAGARYAPGYLGRKLEVSAESVKQLLVNWLDNDVISDEVLDAKRHIRGLRKLSNLD